MSGTSSGGTEKTEPAGAAGVRPWLRLAGITALALAVRFVYLAENVASPFFTHPRLDSLYHDLWAQSIAAGNVWGDQVFFRAPLYAYWLAAQYAALGHDYLIPRIVQHLLGAAVPALIYLLGERIFDKKIAAAASLLCALYPLLIYFEGELLFESLLVFCTMLFLLWVAVTLDKPSTARWAAAGLILGVLCLIRPTFLVFAPLGAAALLRAKTRSLRGETGVPAPPAPPAGSGARYASAFFLGTALVILPVTVRNAVIGGDFVLIATQGGVNFFIGNNPAADGYSSSMPGALGSGWENRDADHDIEREAGRPLKPSEISARWYSKGLSFVFSEPVSAAGLFLRKAYLFLNNIEIPNNRNYASVRDESRVLRLLPLGFWLIGPAGILGMILAWRAGRGRVPALFAAIYALTVVAFFVTDRYRLPLVPVLCLFTSYAAFSLARTAASRSFRTAAAGAAALLILEAVTLSNLAGLDFGGTARDRFRLGLVRLEAGEYDAAIQAFEEVANQKAVPPNLYLSWGAAEEGAGRTEAAVRKYREELRTYPGSYGAMISLAEAYAKAGPPDSSLAFARRAMERKPYVAEPYVLIAKMYARSGAFDSAESVLRDGKKKCGEDFLYGEYLLAGLRHQAGFVDEADSAYRAILKKIDRVRQPLYEPEFGFSAGGKEGEDPQVLHAKLLYGIGHIFVFRNNIDSATSWFERAVAVWKEYDDAWADLGTCYSRAHREAEAGAAFRTSLSLNPGSHLTWYLLGLHLEALGKTAEADSAFRRALEIRPGYFPAAAGRERLSGSMRR